MATIEWAKILLLWRYRAGLEFGLAGLIVFGVATTRADVRPEVQALLDRLGSDYETAESMAELKRELAKPGITPDLMEALKRDYFIPTPKRYTYDRALAALQSRSDLTKADLAILTDEFKRCIKSLNRLAIHQENFVAVGLPVLKHFPSTTHEDLVMEFLRSNNGYVVGVASETLASIGTQRSIQALTKALPSSVPVQKQIAMNRRFDRKTSRMIRARLSIQGPAHLEIVFRQD